MKVVIMAGNRPTGFSPETASLLEDENKRPVLENQLRYLKSQGFTDIIITVNQLKYQIMEYLGDGSDLGVKIEYFNEFMPLGTAGVLFQLKNKLREDFLFINTDDLHSVNFEKLIAYHKEKKSLVTILAQPPRRATNEEHIITDMEGRVKKWPPEDDRRPTKSRKLTGSGIYIISPDLFKSTHFSLRSKVDLDKDLLLPMAGIKTIYCCDVVAVADEPKEIEGSGSNEQGIITVNTETPYEVIIGDGILKDVAHLIEPFCPTGRLALITGVESGKLYGAKVAGSLREYGYEVFTYSKIHGEESKSLSTLENVLNFLSESEIRRIDLIVALGGGVTGDVVGLAAALYMHGMNYVNIPTTLLSAVDSSIGGNTGVDSKAGKNLAGVFHQPSQVIIDTEIIKNLPEKIFNDGLGEVIKYSVTTPIESAMNRILDKTLKANINDIITECVKAKKTIVEKDEFDDKNIRIMLNAGHVAGNAIDKLANGSIPYGQCIALGLVFEAELAEKLRLCGRMTVEQIKDLVEASGMYMKIPFSEDEINITIRAEKKNSTSMIKCILPKGIGKYTIYEL